MFGLSVLTADSGESIKRERRQRKGPVQKLALQQHKRLRMDVDLREFLTGQPTCTRAQTGSRAFAVKEGMRSVSSLRWRPEICFCKRCCQVNEKPPCVPASSGRHFSVQLPDIFPNERCQHGEHSDSTFSHHVAISRQYFQNIKILKNALTPPLCIKTKKKTFFSPRFCGYTGITYWKNDCNWCRHGISIINLKKLYQIIYYNAAFCLF